MPLIFKSSIEAQWNFSGFNHDHYPRSPIASPPHRAFVPGTRSLFPFRSSYCLSPLNHGQPRPFTSLPPLLYGSDAFLLLQNYPKIFSNVSTRCRCYIGCREPTPWMPNHPHHVLKTRDIAQDHHPLLQGPIAMRCPLDSSFKVSGS